MRHVADDLCTKFMADYPFPTGQALSTNGHHPCSTVTEEHCPSCYDPGEGHDGREYHVSFPPSSL